MDSKDIKKNLQLFIESTGRTLIKEEIEKDMNLSRDILTGESLPEIVDGDMNTIQYNKYDLMRVILDYQKKMLNLPNRLMTAHDPIITPKQTV